MEGKLSEIIWNESETKNLQEKIFLSALLLRVHLAISISFKKRSQDIRKIFGENSKSTDIPWAGILLIFEENSPPNKEAPIWLRHSGQFVIDAYM